MDKSRRLTTQHEDAGLHQTRSTQTDTVICTCLSASAVAADTCMTERSEGEVWS